MPDLFDPLRGTPDQLVRPPLPAEQVRRRGDRMRRRRAVGAAAGATLAVALVVSGGLALGGGLTNGSAPAPAPPATEAPSDTPAPSSTPSPGGDWRTSIPTGFPLADDLETPRSTEEELVGPGRDVRAFDVPFEACDRRGDLGAPVDTLGVRHTQPEWFDGRVLQVYGDDAGARAVLEELVGLYDACPEDTFEGPPDTVAVSTVRPVPHGEEGYLVTRTFSVDGLRTTGLELLHVVQVGNALLVSNLSNEGGATDASVARQLGERDALVEDVASAMCVFAENGCAASGDGPEPTYQALGPSGYGDVQLGMSAEEAEATGIITLEDSHGSGCTPFTVLENGRAVARGYVSGSRGVVFLHALVSLATPEGVREGTTRAEVESTYGRLRRNDYGIPAHVPVPDRPGSVYSVGFDDRDRVDELLLLDERQDCVG